MGYTYSIDTNYNRSEKRHLLILKTAELLRVIYQVGESAVLLSHNLRMRIGVSAILLYY